METQTNTLGIEWMTKLLERLPVCEAIKDINTCRRIPGFRESDLVTAVCRGVNVLKNTFDILSEVNKKIDPEERGRLQGAFQSSGYEFSRLAIPHEGIYHLSNSLFESLPEFGIILEDIENPLFAPHIGECLVSSLQALNSEGERLSKGIWKHSLVTKNLLYPIDYKNLFFHDNVFKYFPKLIDYCGGALDYLENGKLQGNQIDKIKKCLGNTREHYEKIRKRHESKHLG